VHKRRNSVKSIAVALLGFAASPTYGDSLIDGPKGITGNWSLLFNDDFNGSEINKDNWATCYWWSSEHCTNLQNKELQLYLPYNIEVSDGKLHLIARREIAADVEGRKFGFTSGIVTTSHYPKDLPSQNRFTFRYGHVEINAKIPSGKGLWPALWLLPENLKSRPEIDIVEVLGDTPNKLRMHFHYNDKKNGRYHKLGFEAATIDLSKDWHVYGLRWEPNVIIWYLDGVEMWRYTDAINIPSEPMYLLMNLAVGGTWPGKPNSNTKFPSIFSIDYVRVWKSRGA
jgi:beta-glucanase (GH16 family)